MTPIPGSRVAGKRDRAYRSLFRRALERRRQVASQPEAEHIDRRTVQRDACNFALYGVANAFHGFVPGRMLPHARRGGGRPFRRSRLRKPFPSVSHSKTRF
jgi:hypothetical protein